MKARRAIPEAITRLMSDEDRYALQVETYDQAATRGDARRERDLQRQCETFLTYRRIRYLHLSPRAREQAGWPDLTFCAAGRPMAVELKTPAGRLSDDQRECLGAMRRDGWHVYVCRSFGEFRDAVDGEAKEWQP